MTWSSSADIYIVVWCAGDVYVAADSGREVSGLAGLVSRSIDVVQGFKVLGHHRVERALPMGTRLTAIGELVNTDTTVRSQPFACCLKPLLMSENCPAEDCELLETTSDI